MGRKMVRRDGRSRGKGRSEGKGEIQLWKMTQKKRKGRGNDMCDGRDEGEGRGKRVKRSKR